MSSLSTTSAIITVFVSTLGMGLLLIPSGYDRTGIIWTPILLAFLAAITGFNLYCLGYAALARRKSKKDLTYPELAKEFSPVLYYMVNTSLLLSNLGTMAILSRHLVEKIMDLILHFIGVFPSKSKEQFVFYMVLTSCVLTIVLILNSNNKSILSFLSKLSMSVIAVYVVFVLYLGSFQGVKMSTLKTKVTEPGQSAFSCIFALHCQCLFLFIFNQMVDQSLKTLRFVCIVSSVLIFAIYAGSGFLGYKFVGPDINARDLLVVFSDDNIISRVGSNSWDSNGYLFLIIRVAFCFVFFGSVIFASQPITPILMNTTTWLGYEPLDKSFITLFFGSFIFLFIALKDQLKPDKCLGAVASCATNPLSFFFPSVFMVLVQKRLTVTSVVSSLLAFTSIALMFYGLYLVISK